MFIPSISCSMGFKQILHSLPSAWPSFPWPPVPNGAHLESVCAVSCCPGWISLTVLSSLPRSLTPWQGVSAVPKGLKWTPPQPPPPQCSFGVRVLRRPFISSVFICPRTTQQQAQRGKGDCPGSHSRIVPEQPQTSWTFGVKEAQPSVPSLLFVVP